MTFESKVIDEVAVIRCKGRHIHGLETEGLEKEIERQTKVAGTKLRRNGEGIEILRLLADFHPAEAGEAGGELLSRLQQAIAAPNSG